MLSTSFSSKKRFRQKTPKIYNIYIAPFKIKQNCAHQLFFYFSIFISNKFIFKKTQNSADLRFQNSKAKQFYPMVYIVIYAFTAKTFFISK